MLKLFFLAEFQFDDRPDRVFELLQRRSVLQLLALHARVMPYISTQIILQLLMLVIPSLKLASDPSGHKKLQQYTRYGTVVACLLQSYVVTITHNRSPAC